MCECVCECGSECGCVVGDLLAYYIHFTEFCNLIGEARSCLVRSDRRVIFCE